MELLEGYEFLIESLVIAFDLATTTRIVWPAENQVDPVFMRFSFKTLGDESFSFIDINFTWDSFETECPVKSVYR